MQCNDRGWGEQAVVGVVGVVDEREMESACGKWETVVCVGGGGESKTCRSGSARCVQVLGSVGLEKAWP